MMTLEEAIKFAREVANGDRCECSNRRCTECNEDHEQLAAWLTELQEKRCKVIVQANRIKELEEGLKEELAKRLEELQQHGRWHAYAKIDELVLKEEQG